MLDEKHGRKGFEAALRMTRARSWRDDRRRAFLESVPSSHVGIAELVLSFMDDPAGQEEPLRSTLAKLLDARGSLLVTLLDDLARIIAANVRPIARQLARARAVEEIHEKMGVSLPEAELHEPWFEAATEKLSRAALALLGLSLPSESGS